MALRHRRIFEPLGTFPVLDLKILPAPRLARSVESSTPRRTLQEEREFAERIEVGIKQLRARPAAADEEEDSLIPGATRRFDTP